MDINSFRYFVELAESRNVTKTAQKVGLTQQALSAQMSRLESNYGVILFDRANHFALTEAGERLLTYSRQMISWSDRVADEMHDLSSGNRGSITIGCTTKRGYALIPMIFEVFHQEWPNIRVDLLEARTGELTQHLLEHRTDFCFLVTDPANPRITTVPILEERLQLFISDELLRKHCSAHYDELISNKNNEFPIQYFSNCPLLLQSGANRVRIRCNSVFEREHIIPNIIFTSSNAMSLLRIAQIGVGAAFLVASTKEDSSYALHRFYISDISPVEYLKIGYLEEHYLSLPARRFIELAQDILPVKLPGKTDIAGLL